MILLWTAFTIGLLGSFHCIGMCGPIAFALPLDRTSKWSIYSGSLTYNLGRLSGYSLIGVVFGIIGLSFSVFGWQQVLSIAIGFLMILSLFVSAQVNSGKWSLKLGQIKVALSGRFKKQGLFNLYLIGFLNAFLPCGLVYMALAGATAAGGALGGLQFMLFFGLGTLPLMWAVAVIGASVKLSWRTRIRQVTPYFVFAIGLLFILRGLDLGIPYISPELSKIGTQTVNCH